MLWNGVFVAILFAVVRAATTGYDELEKFLLEAMQSNETYSDIDFEGEKPCLPFVNEMPNYKRLGRRISETRQLNLKQDGYLIVQSKVGTRLPRRRLFDVNLNFWTCLQSNWYHNMYRKCLEYVWDLESRDKQEQWAQRCQMYIISQIKKGVVPDIVEYYFLINSPVIFGGRTASRGEFPHMGAIGWRSKEDSPKWLFKCGSTLISEKFSLTAAHCSMLSLRQSPDIADPKPKIVRFGVEDLVEKELVTDQSVDANIKRVIRHPSYNPPKKYFDIALIELESPLEFKGNLHPACLWPYLDTSHLGTEAILSGWGYTEGGKQATDLQTAVVDIIETTECDDILKVYRNRNWGGFQETQMCAGKLVGGIDTCQGDSGGPLQVRVPLKTAGKMYQILGITSFGIRCGQRNRPGVYTRVSSFIDWIEDTVWGHNETISSTA